jgi:hypothetical protein
MNAFQRSSLRIEVDEVLDPAEPFSQLFAGHTPSGQRYLIVQTAGNEHAGRWMCAPITERALACVVAGKADIRDVIAHTSTGEVDVIAVEADGRCVDFRKMSHEVCEDDLPASGRRLVCV